MWWLLAGCAPSGPGTLLHAPGEAGDHGAAWVETRVPVRVTESLSVEVAFPADADGWPDADALPAPAVVLAVSYTHLRAHET